MKFKFNILTWGTFLWMAVSITPDAKAQLPPNQPQELIAKQVLKNIEQQKQEEVIKLLDPANKKSIESAKLKLAEAMKVIKALRSNGAYSTIMTVGGNDGFYRRYRCRYHIDGERQDDFYLIDIYFTNEKSQKIGKLHFENSAQLLKKQLERERSNSTPPPIPPKTKE